MKTVLIIMCCSALVAAAESPARIHADVPTVPAAHVAAKPISRPQLPPARVSTIPKRGAAPAAIGGSMFANSKGAAALNGTGIRNQGGKK